MVELYCEPGGEEGVRFRPVPQAARNGDSEATGGTNPVYLAQFSESRPASKTYSKRFASAENPQKDFAALFSCDDAAEKCPIVEGAALRLPIP